MSLVCQDCPENRVTPALPGLKALRVILVCQDCQETRVTPVLPDLRALLDLKAFLALMANQLRQ